MLVENINLDFIRQAASAIEEIACRTPLKKSINLSQRLQKNVYLKMETMQDTGAFKLRGAANVIMHLSEKEKASGVVTASTGNHGRAVAYVANALGIKAIVCMSSLVPVNKIAAIEQLGAQVVIYGDNQDLATEKALQIAQQQQMRFISPFDDPYVIAGQGTIALEILQQRPEIDTIITQLSGGGLASGIAIAAKALRPDIKIIGVSVDHGAAMYESIKAGKIVNVLEQASIADALPGPIPADNRYTFDICRRLIDDIVLVSEQQIKDAMCYSLKQEKLVLEGAGAATIAMLLQRSPVKIGDNIAVICSGDNVDMKQLLNICDSL
ncbi:MAG: hypothetical protein OFPI_25120 [Osedax symbiont Rs2]|nr:MAG: hypothetical protein OFPI_25120 [Osedax symbiont Rs2]